MNPGNKKILRIAVAVFCLGLLGAGIYLERRRETEQALLKRLYSMACLGDLDAVKGLSESRSADATPLLETLAENRDATSNSRVAAINALGKKGNAEDSILASLLEINQPFAVRTAAFHVLDGHGCQGKCISATLSALFSLWKGEKTEESALTVKEMEQKYGVHLDPEQDAKANAELRSKTEQNYLELLNSNPCEALNTARKNFSFATQFLLYLSSQVHACRAGG